MFGDGGTLPFMRILDFGVSEASRVGRPLSKEAAFAPIIDTLGGGHVGCMHLGPNGILDRHPAASAQLLCVIAGKGEVSGGEGIARPIQAGQAVLWEAGEEHETSTSSGLTAIVFEVGGYVETGDPSHNRSRS
jgi:quercetin dioxygenase-like cupin family protein